MNSRTTKRFRDLLAELPEQVHTQAQEAYQLFQQNPAHPSLRFRQVHPIRPIYSARININYRAVGIRDGSDIVWFWIGPHDEYEQLLTRA